MRHAILAVLLLSACGPAPTGPDAGPVPDPSRGFCRSACDDTGLTYTWERCPEDDCIDVDGGPAAEARSCSACGAEYTDASARTSCDAVEESKKFNSQCP